MTWFTFRHLAVSCSPKRLYLDLMSGLSDKEIRELRKTFDSYDLNRDGFINPEEFHALLIELDGDVSREECLLDFEVADTEGDGYIGFKEFVAWWTS